MAATYQLIASSTVGAGGASSIDFTSIPATYTDLCLKVSARDTYAGNWRNIYLKINSTTTGYTTKFLYGNNGSTGSFSGGTTENYIGYENSANSTASTFANIEIYIPNYAGSNAKSYSIDSVTETNGADAVAALVASNVSATAAITSLSLIPNNGSSNFAQYTTAYLYGIKNS